MDYWMLPGEAAEPLRVAASPSAPHAISACIYLMFNPPLQLLSLIQVVSALFCFSILKGYLDGYVLSKRRWALPWSKRGNRNIREYSKSVNHFACPTGRLNQQKCWICWEMVKNWTVRIRGVFVLHLLWAGFTGGIGLFDPLHLLKISPYTCLLHSRYHQLGFLSLRPKSSPFSSRFNVNSCSNLKMSPWASLEYKSFYLIEFCLGYEMLSSLVPFSSVELLVNLQFKAIQLTTH